MMFQLSTEFIRKVMKEEHTRKTEMTTCLIGGMSSSNLLRWINGGQCLKQGLIHGGIELRK